MGQIVTLQNKARGTTSAKKDWVHVEVDVAHIIRSLKTWAVVMAGAGVLLVLGLSPSWFEVLGYAAVWYLVHAALTRVRVRLHKPHQQLVVASGYAPSFIALVTWCAVWPDFGTLTVYSVAFLHALALCMLHGGLHWQDRLFAPIGVQRVTLRVTVGRSTTYAPRDD